MPNKKFQQYRVFVRNDLVEKKKIKSCRKLSKRFLEFKKSLDQTLTCDERDIISALQVAFEGEIILIQYCIENKRIDSFFLNTNLEQKLINMTLKAEILIMKKVDN